MYSNIDIMHQAYFSVTNWHGGLYATASPAGSRSGASSVGAWFAMMYHGYTGYKENAGLIVDALKYLKTEINNMPEL